MYQDTQDLLNSLGPEPDEAKAFDYSSSGQSYGATYTAGVSGDSQTGIASGIQTLAQQRDTDFTAKTGIAKPAGQGYYFPEVADAMSNPDTQPSRAGQLVFGASDAVLPGGMMVPAVAKSMMNQQAAWENQIKKYNQDNGTQFQTMPDFVQTANSVVKQQQQDASTVEARSPGISGWIARTAGGAAASFSGTNPLNLLTAVGGPEANAAKFGWSTLARAGQAGLTNVITGLAGSFGLEQSQRAGINEPVSNQEIAGQIPGNFFGGAIFHTVHEGLGAGFNYFKDMFSEKPQVQAKVNELADTQSPTGRLAQSISQSPDAATETMMTSPATTASDVINKVDDDPTTGVRGIQQAAEREHLLEANQPADTEWHDYVNKLNDASDRLETGTVTASAPERIPELPPSLDNASPRYGQAELNFHNDVDRALYIVREGSRKQSAAHDQYMDWLRNTVGMSDQDIRNGSEQVTNRIKSVADTKTPGSVDIPQFYETRQMSVPAIDKATDEAGKQGTEDYLDQVLNEIRSGKTVAPKHGPTLLQFISKRGGMTDEGGDLKSMGADTWHLNDKGKPRVGVRKLIRPQDSELVAGRKSPYSPDYTTEAAHEAGYFGHGERPSINDLYSAIENELNGTPRHADTGFDIEGQSHADFVDNVREHLDRLGVDLGEHDNASARGAINEDLATGGTPEFHEDDYFPDMDELHSDGAYDEHAQQREAVGGLRDAIAEEAQIGETGVADEQAQRIAEAAAATEAKRIIPTNDVQIDDEGKAVGKNQGEIMDEIKDSEGLLKAMTSCLVG